MILMGINKYQVSQARNNMSVLFIEVILGYIQDAPMKIDNIVIFRNFGGHFGDIHSICPQANTPILVFKLY